MRLIDLLHGELISTNREFIWFGLIFFIRLTEFTHLVFCSCYLNCSSTTSWSRWPTFLGGRSCTKLSTLSLMTSLPSSSQCLLHTGLCFHPKASQYKTRSPNQNSMKGNKIIKMGTVNNWHCRASMYHLKVMIKVHWTR